MGAGDKFYLVGIFTAIEGIIAVAIFPTISKYLSRRTIFLSGAIIMLVGYALFLFSANSLPLVLLAITLFFSPYPILFLVVLMTITDSVEYGQWKLGIRNESVTLSLRPLIDKLAGAFANGIVGIAAVAAGMTGAAKPEDITSAGMQSFNLFMFYIPIILIVISVIIYWFKVTLTEKKHAQIVIELEKRLHEEEANKN
jgi:lactose/raffinose/galactose permease